jgi:superoxide reductase
MAEVYEIYKCEVCGNIVEVLHGGAGTLVCCGEKMQKIEEKTKEMATEKHVPFVKEVPGGVEVKVGYNEDHPMKEEHYIEWIAVLTDDGIIRKFLKPGDEPKAQFNVEKSDIKKALEYCNIHSLWKSE